MPLIRNAWIGVPVERLLSFYFFETYETHALDGSQQRYGPKALQNICCRRVSIKLVDESPGYLSSRIAQNPGRGWLER